MSVFAQLAVVELVGLVGLVVALLVPSVTRDRPYEMNTRLDCDHPE